MTIPLQKTGHEDSHYERPNQKWVCGRLKEGNPCHHGPSGKGQCLAQAQTNCSPRKEGDRWLCTRPENFGGPCHSGPLPDGQCVHPEGAQFPCQPALSLRARRGYLIKMCLIIIVGILVLSLFVDTDGLGYVSPGELSSVHMAIQPSGGDGPNCVVCHSVLEGGEHHWFVNAFARGETNKDSQKCMDCHFNKDQTSGNHALFAHGMNPKVLEKKTEDAKAQKSEASNFSSRGSHVDFHSNKEISCATCHIEHHGKHNDLTIMNDTNCQMCHQNQFHSFNKGHPEFKAVKRTSQGINFDHAKHKRFHFGSKSFDCRACHDSDSSGKMMDLKPFSVTCSGCHAQGSKNHHGEAIKRNTVSIFQLPLMEFEEEVSWSEDVALGDEELSSIMKLLLAGDDDTVEALQDLGEEADWIPYDWEVDDELKIQLSQALKRLLFDFTSEEGDLSKRLAKVFGTNSTDPVILRLVEKFESSTFAMKAFQTKWLPSLEDDLNENGFQTVTGDNTQWPLMDQMTGWQIETDTVSLQYRPVAHADPFIVCLLDALAHFANASDEDDPLSDAESFRKVLRTDIFKTMKSPEGGTWFNSCLRCHSTDSHQGAFRINWKAAGREMGATGFGKFNHRPHMSMLNQENNCLHCHKVHEKDGAQHSGSRGLLPHNKETCAACHKPGGANNSCLNCHNYHEHRN